MKMLKFAAGLAVGYVLGARAGRGRYQQIVEGARNLADQPAVTQAQSKVTSLFSGEEAGEGSPPVVTPADSAATASTEPKPPSQRRSTPPASTTGSGTP
ncbi:MAG: hypothetical protein ACRDWG_16980 [Actinomycetes bacterium]|jgi:hypothetical protein|nr:hypothetical protein [Actinomycetes bacterium]